MDEFDFDSYKQRFEILHQQLMDNATLTSQWFGVVQRPDDMQSLYDLLDEAKA